jgi:SAM-dependent methyltransferase
VDDVAYYVALARRAGAMLEYGIGNGRIAIPAACAGASVVGVDHSPPMLADLRARLADAPPEVRARVRAVRGDIRRARLGQKFPLVVCTFNTALHLYTRADVEHFLERVRAHLAPGGRFVVDLAMPAIADLARPAGRAYHAPRFRHPTAGVVVSNREFFDYDPVRQVLFVTMEFEPVEKRAHGQRARRGDPGRVGPNSPSARACLRDEASARGWVTPLAHRQFFPCEWEALLHYNGFAVERVEGDFAGGPLTPDSEVMIWHATRSTRTRSRR